MTPQENAFFGQIGPGTPIGALMRLWWMPSDLSPDLPSLDYGPIRIRHHGQDFIALQNTGGKAGWLDEYCV